MPFSMSVQGETAEKMGSVLLASLPQRRTTTDMRVKKGRKRRKAGTEAIWHGTACHVSWSTRRPELQTGVKFVSQSLQLGCHYKL